MRDGAAMLYTHMRLCSTCCHNANVRVYGTHWHDARARDIPFPPQRIVHSNPPSSTAAHTAVAATRSNSNPVGPPNPQAIASAARPVLAPCWAIAAPCTGGGRPWRALMVRTRTPSPWSLPCLVAHRSNSNGQAAGPLGAGRALQQAYGGRLAEAQACERRAAAIPATGQ